MLTTLLFFFALLMSILTGNDLCVNIKHAIKVTPLDYLMVFILVLLWTLFYHYSK